MKRGSGYLGPRRTRRDRVLLCSDVEQLYRRRELLHLSGSSGKTGDKIIEFANQRWQDISHHRGKGGYHRGLDRLARGHLRSRRCIHALFVTPTRSSYGYEPHRCSSYRPADWWFEKARTAMRCYRLTGTSSSHRGDKNRHARSRPAFRRNALIDRAPRSASVSSEADTKLMVMKRSDFFDIVRKDHDVAVKLLWSFLGFLANGCGAPPRARRRQRTLSSVDFPVQLLNEDI